MNCENLNKGKEIKATVKHLTDRFGENSFKIQDNWNSDGNAIGLVDNEMKYLVYISTYDGEDFYVSLENLKTVGDFPYEAVADFHNVNLEELCKIFAQHLRI